MECPFPGRDPYLERKELWPDFHDAFIAYIREALQPLLRPRYAALAQNRLYVVEHERPIYPDVSVVTTSAHRGSGPGTSSVLEVDQPLVLELETEEIRQPFLQIIEPAANNRVVAAIEVLSPDNKSTGPGRDSYCRKYDELWAAGTHMIEIDLLRGGQRVPRVLTAHIPDDPPWNFVVSVSRWPNRLETYRFGIRQRLPRIGIPLANGDNDVALDLQAVFAQSWKSGPYPELLNYGSLPLEILSDVDTSWARQIAMNANPSSA